MVVWRQVPEIRRIEVQRQKPFWAVVMALFLAVLAVPTAANAWTVTVRVHGAGGVEDVQNRFGDPDPNMTNCTVDPSFKSESSETNCVGGTANGLYNGGNVV